MCAPALVVPLISAVIGAGAAVYSSNKAEKTADKQRRQQEDLAKQQSEKRTDMEGGVVNLDENTGAPSGLGNTFLTGAGGIGNDKLNLGGGNKTLGG